MPSLKDLANFEKSCNTASTSLPWPFAGLQQAFSIVSTRSLKTATMTSNSARFNAIHKQAEALASGKPVDDGHGHGDGHRPQPEGLTARRWRGPFVAALVQLAIM